MRAGFYALLNLVWTLVYFVWWGLCYGMWLGAVTGTAVFPAIGSFIGCFMGVSFGLICGVCVGLWVAFIHALFFHRDTDLALYRRRLSRGVGLALLIIGMVGLLLFIAGSWPNPLRWSLSEWLFLIGLSTAITIWVSLSMAYAASSYPDEMVKRLIRQNHTLDNAAVEVNTEAYSIPEPIERFLHHIYPPWAHVVAAILGGLIAFALALTNVMYIRTLPDVVLLLGIGAILGIFSLFLFAAHCALANAFLIIFLKRVVLSELNLSPHWYRVNLTLIAGILTLIITWWTFIFAPVCALYMAYQVYHTLALPPEGYDKAKRKEKGSVDNNAPALI